MKRLLLLLVSPLTMLVLAYPANPLLAQELIGLSILPGDTTVTVVSIDPVTGAQRSLMATPAIGVVGTSSALTIDAASRRVFFVSIDPGTTSLYVVDLVHRTVSATPTNFGTTVLWDPVGKQLLGLGYLPGDTTVTVASIDPATAAVTPLVPTTIPGIDGGTVTIDPAGRRIFFEGAPNGAPNELNIVDLANRTVSQTPLPCCPPLVWDPAGNRLLGMSFVDNHIPLTVVSIDLSTGSQTPLLPTPSGGVSLGYVTIDPATGRVFFADPFAHSLVTANLQRGNVLQSPLAPCCPPLGWLAAAVPVPALDASGLAVLGLALAILGWRFATRTPAR